MSDMNFPPQATTTSALIGDPSAFGRVSEDGTVFVRTPDGEKAVGSYPGKSADEALAYFVRKFEVIAGEVVLLAARIKSGALVPSDAYAAVKKLREQVKDINAVGDLAALSASVEQIEPLIEDHRAAYEVKKAAEVAAKAARREQILVEKEKIVAEAEGLAQSESWKTTGDRLKVLMDEWKAAPRLDKTADAELWKRFSSSRNKFDKRRRTHFAALEATQSVVSDAKKNIVAEAQTLATSTQWVPTAKAFKALMDQWKAAGRGKPSDDAKLWARFKAAQDTFFTAKNADLAKRDLTMATNLIKREELLTLIEAILPITDIKAARKHLSEHLRSWEKIGMTHRDKRAALDIRVAAVEATVKTVEAENFRKTDLAAKKRAEEVVAQLTESIASYEKVAEKSTASGNTKKATEAQESADARREWLADAEKSLAQFD